MLLDRSVFSDSVFAAANHQQGAISTEGMQCIEQVNCLTKSIANLSK